MLQQAEISEEHKAEIFNHVYQFFSRYYDNGDFISKRRYSSESKYAIPYNGEEVILHWANKDQYYIKTTEYFNNYAFDVRDYRVQFRVVSAETAQNNNQNSNRFFVLADVDNQFSFDAVNNELTVFFEYRELNSQEETDLGKKQEAINEKIETAILENVEAETLKNLLKREKKKVKKKSISVLLHHLNSYVRRNTSDYFIHKDLEGFLRCELDFYIKNEVLNLDDLAALSEGNLKRLMARTLAIKKIAIQVIEFLAQIEEFQKKLWEKKKFVVRAEYCMTLDRVPEEFYSKILKNEVQIEEWKELFKLEEVERGTLNWDNEKNTVKIDMAYLKNHPYLVIDTKFFDQDFKDRLFNELAKKGIDLDEEIGGLLIKSENWQALNLLQEKYRELKAFL